MFGSLLRSLSSYLYTNVFVSEIYCFVSKKFYRNVREALEIQVQETSPRNEHGLNQDDGQYVTTPFWKPMFSYLQENRIEKTDVN